MANILILYYYNQYPPRATHIDNLYSFRGYSSNRCYYLNVAIGKIPWYVKRFPWDLVIFHDLFVCSRWSRELFIKNVEKIRFLINSDAVKVIIPQDEFLNMDLVCNFINEFGISYVFSVSPESEWHSIYHTVDFKKVRFHKVLTGYVDYKLVKTINKLTKEVGLERPIDVGYRTHPTSFWLGRHAMQKEIMGNVVLGRAKQKGLSVDISTRSEDTIPGNDWYRFLLRCKYQLGVEGGASILDWDGTFRKRTDEYLSQHPQASFEEVEKECFPGVDGSLKLYAISPRHFECCITRTCQVLIEGYYDGVLLPGKHYIELKRDYSNLEEVLDIIAEDELRGEITTRAWQDIVESGKYSYRIFANHVIDNSLANFTPRAQSTRSAIWQFIIYYSMLLQDKLSWLAIALQLIPWNWLRSVVPISLQMRLRRLIIR